MDKTYEHYIEPMKERINAKNMYCSNEHCMNKPIFYARYLKLKFFGVEGILCRKYFCAHHAKEYADKYHLELKNEQ